MEIILYSIQLCYLDVCELVVCLVARLWNLSPRWNLATSVFTTLWYTFLHAYPVNRSSVDDLHVALQILDWNMICSFNNTPRHKQIRSACSFPVASVLVITAAFQMLLLYFLLWHNITGHFDSDTRIESMQWMLEVSVLCHVMCTVLVSFQWSICVGNCKTVSRSELLWCTHFSSFRICCASCAFVVPLLCGMCATYEHSAVQVPVLYEYTKTAML